MGVCKPERAQKNCGAHRTKNQKKRFFPDNRGWDRVPANGEVANWLGPTCGRDVIGKNKLNFLSLPGKVRNG